MTQADRPDDDERDDEGEARGAGSVVAAPSKPVGGSPFALYKPGQGEYVRWCSTAGAGVIAACLAWFLYAQLGGMGETLQLLAPVGAMVVLAGLIFRLIGQNQRVVDFMIATEGELKKVNWSTRREVIGNTRVVIFVIVAVGFLLFIVDVGFIGFFEGIGVLRLGMFKSMFSSSLGG